MFPYVVPPIQTDKLYDVICACKDGAKVYINSDTYVEVHRVSKKSKPLQKVEVVEEAPIEALTVPKEAGRSAEPAATPPAVQENDGKIRCDNPKCPWPGDLHDKKDMTEWNGKYFCILDCCLEAKDGQNFAHKADSPDPGITKYAPPWHPKYDSCVVCHETKRKYMAKGMCTRCYLNSK